MGPEGPSSVPSGDTTFTRSPTTTRSEAASSRPTMIPGSATGFAGLPERRMMSSSSTGEPCPSGASGSSGSPRGPRERIFSGV